MIEVLDDKRLAVVVNEAARKKLIPASGLKDELQRWHGHPGIGRLRRIDERWHPLNYFTLSELESLFLKIYSKANLGEPAVNDFVGGMKVDYVWHDLKLIVELDGREFHDSDSAFETDRERTAALELLGYRVLRLTWGMVVFDERGCVDKLKGYARLLGAEHLTARRAGRTR
ncbi:MAG: endonuclease domain-containing protein [Actinomycetota bacterium]|nr:endonuclease domain-containing protein [Actinomycetota bacterium]